MPTTTTTIMGPQICRLTNFRRACVVSAYGRRPFLHSDLTPPVGAFSNNVSGYYYEPRFTTYVAAGGKHTVGLCQWDSKFDNVKTDQIIMHDETEDVNPVIIQVKLVSPNDRGPPIVVVTTITHVRLYAVADTKHLFSIRQPGFKTKTELTKEYEDRDASGKNTLQDVVANAKELYQISRGITCVDSSILVGCNDGSILVMHCNNSRHVSLKPTLKEHQNPIIGLATCAYDYLTVCADVTGDVSVWPRNFKTVTKRISTKHNISAINILRKHIIVGNYQGLVLLFNIASGELVAEISAHGREVTSVSVAPESAYMLTASRDGVVNIWKLHTRRPEAFSVEFRHSEKVENRMLTGAVFLNSRGNTFITGAYDDNRLNIYRISKRLMHS